LIIPNFAGGVFQHATDPTRCECGGLKRNHPQAAPVVNTDVATKSDLLELLAEFKKSTISKPVPIFATSFAKLSLAKRNKHSHEASSICADEDFVDAVRVDALSWKLIDNSFGESGVVVKHNPSANVPKLEILATLKKATELIRLTYPSILLFDPSNDTSLTRAADLFDQSNSSLNIKATMGDYFFTDGGDGSRKISEQPNTLKKTVFIVELLSRNKTLRGSIAQWNATVTIQVLNSTFNAPIYGAVLAPSDSGTYYEIHPLKWCNGLACCDGKCPFTAENFSSIFNLCHNERMDAVTVF
jgi:hypothetical protein